MRGPKSDENDDEEKSNSSSDDQFADNEPLGVYKYMTPANPLEKTKDCRPLEVNTAFKIKFE